jgi:integrase
MAACQELEGRKDVGRAISPEEQEKLLDAAARCVHLLYALRFLHCSSPFRSGEALGLRWRQVNLFDRTVTVGRAKTSNGTGRVIPINDDLASIMASHRRWFVERFAEPHPDH